MSCRLPHLSAAFNMIYEVFLLFLGADGCMWEPLSLDTSLACAKKYGTKFLKKFLQDAPASC